MTATAIVGAGWGDEGKGKITDLLAADAAAVVRFAGGRNAGHTLVDDAGPLALHLLPCGVLRPGVCNVLGPGVALDPFALLDELDGLAARGLATPELRVSERAQLALPWHAQLDTLEEERLGESAFGSTRAGIAPFYAEKCLKTGVQAADLRDPARLRQRLRAGHERRRVWFAELYARDAPDPDATADALEAIAPRILPLLDDTTVRLRALLDAGAQVLVEGQLGTLRDPDHGIQPWTTSSSPLAGSACAGAGLRPSDLTRIVAVSKAYASCVGTGPFPSELEPRLAARLRRRGGADGEYGATTGRPRRIGAFDAVALRYGCAVQGATEVALTNLDALSGLETIPICVGYEIDGERTDAFPTTGPLERARPVREEHPGWSEDLRGARKLSDLPRNARTYLDHLEALLETPIRIVSVGPHRDQTLSRGIVDGLGARDLG